MMRSRSGRSSKVRSRADDGDLFAWEARWVLAAMFPRDQEAEEDVQSAEAEGHESVAARRDEKCERADGEEAGAHGGEQRDRECAAGDHTGAIEKQPERGHQGREAEMG